jgi:hypothetical protein
MDKFSFCESVHATSTSSWHIRPLTKVGRKTGGGIDTTTLCGRISRGWDIETPIEHHIDPSSYTCKACWEMFMKNEKKKGLTASKKVAQKRPATKRLKPGLTQGRRAKALIWSLKMLLPELKAIERELSRVLDEAQNDPPEGKSDGTITGRKWGEMTVIASELEMLIATVTKRPLSAPKNK